MKRRRAQEAGRGEGGGSGEIGHSTAKESVLAEAPGRAKTKVWILKDPRG